METLETMIPSFLQMVREDLENKKKEIKVKEDIFLDELLEEEKK